MTIAVTRRELGRPTRRCGLPVLLVDLDTSPATPHGVADRVGGLLGQVDLGRWP